MTQQTKYLREQFVESNAVIYAKVRDRMVINQIHTSEPLKRRIDFTQAGNLPRRSNPTAVGVDPNGNEQTRVKCASPCRAFEGVNTLIKGVQIQLSNELPDRACRVFGADQLLNINRP